MAAGGAARCSLSPEVVTYSRKRPREDDVEEGITKKSNCSSGNDGVYHFKILVPSIAAGAIIGKGGETIAQLQKDTNARIKMSKANDFYPGTTERVCLISGNTGSIMEVLDFITFKIREKPEITSKNTVEYEAMKATEREKQIKILVPNSTAGMIIGKGGNYIKKLKDESGSYVQISQKARDQSLQERCITVIGDADSNKKACRMILSKIQEDVQSSASLTVSYSETNGPVANFSPTGSPYAQTTNSSHQFPPSAGASAINPSLTWAGLSESAGLAGATLTLNLEPSSVPSQTVLSQVVSAITIALNNTAYPQHIKTEIANAITTLGKYRMLGVSWAPPPPSYLGLHSLEPNPNGFFGQMTANVTTTRSVIDLALEPYRHPAPGTSSPPILNSNAIVIGNHDRGDKNHESQKVEVEIPERLVGAVLGEGGRCLAGLQEASGATVQISKKGVFVPGTRNRLAAISGSPPAIFIAHSLIQHRIAEEEMKRARHHI